MPMTPTVEHLSTSEEQRPSTEVREGSEEGGEREEGRKEGRKAGKRKRKGGRR